MRRQLHSSLISSTLALLACTQPAIASAKVETDISSSDEQVELPVLGLEVAKKQNASGLEHEGLKDEELDSLKTQALTFIQFRRGKLTPKERLFLTAECISRPESNLYCDFILEQAQGSRSPASKNPGSEPELSPAELAELLKKSDASPFHGTREGLIHRALARHSDWSTLEPITKTVLKSSCKSSSLPVALAQKAEEYFPDQKFRDLAKKLFAKASECQDEGASKARYRLSLLHVWADRCGDAVPHLERLTAEPDGDYVSRSLYWRAHCAKESGNKILHKALTGRLLKEYPLSYHSLVMTGGKNAEIARILDTTEPVVRFRSERKPELNRLVRGIELLQELRANDLALELTRPLLAKIQNTETSFRLYVTLLLDRSGDMIGQFQVLSSIFRDQPSDLSRATLQMFYPLRRWEVLKKHGAKVDPYLVAALIRQESGFNENARSPVGALGLMQLMPETARRLERRVSKRQLQNPGVNVRLGVKYFDSLLDRFDRDAELALAAYNAGPHRVDDWKRRYTTSDRMLFFDLIPYKETRNYVVLIARNYYWYLNLYSQWNPVMQTAGNPPKAGRSPASTRKPLVFTLFNSI